MIHELPHYATEGAWVLVPDLDSQSRPAPMVLAKIVRVIDVDGERAGIVDVHVASRAYDPEGGFRLGDTIKPPQVVSVGKGHATHLAWSPSLTACGLYWTDDLEPVTEFSCRSCRSGMDASLGQAVAS